MSHGIITAADSRELTIDIRCQTACQNCGQAHNCTLKNASHRQIKLKNPDTAKYSVGQSVELTLSRTARCLSVIFAYILPLVILLSVLGIGSLLGYSETTAALTALGATGGYFLCLPFLNRWLEKKIKIEIA